MMHQYIIKYTWLWWKT